MSSGLLAALLLVLPLSASARDASVDPVRSIDDLYFHRDQADNLARSLAVIDEDLKGAGPQESTYYWLRCRSLIRRGEDREKKSDQLADYEAARSACEKSVSLSSGSADAHFWLGVAMGRWGEAKGVLRSLFLIGPIRREMAATLALDPRYGGAHRVLGEMLWQIPGFAGGNKKKALEEFETAVRLWPDHVENYQALAEAYLHFGRKDDAARILNAVVSARSPADPAEYPESLADARKTLAGLAAR
jgi:tetratricopeptide (TPR) repeat protein